MISAADGHPRARYGSVMSRGQLVETASFNGRHRLGFAMRFEERRDRLWAVVVLLALVAILAA